jgi:hypothetical protein
MKNGTEGFAFAVNNLLFTRIHGNRKDLSGQKFNNLLVVLPYDNLINRGKVRYCCRCDCGKIKITYGDNLVTNSVKSCGCLGSISRAKGYRQPDHLLIHPRKFTSKEKLAEKRKRYWEKKGIKVPQELEILLAI